MAYCGQSDLLNYVDSVQLGAFTDDYSQGTLNTAILNSICQLASNQADSLVSSVYQVPFVGTIPIKIYTASVVFAVEMLYARRLTPGQVNPMTEVANHWRKTLMDVNRGLLSLDYQVQRSFTPVAINTSISRVNSSIF